MAAVRSSPAGVAGSSCASTTRSAICSRNWNRFEIGYCSTIAAVSQNGCSTTTSTDSASAPTLQLFNHESYVLHVHHPDRNSCRRCGSQRARPIRKLFTLAPVRPYRHWDSHYPVARGHIALPGRQQCRDAAPQPISRSPHCQYWRIGRRRHVPSDRQQHTACSVGLRACGSLFHLP